MNVQPQLQYVRQKDRVQVAVARYENRRTLWARVKTSFATYMVEFREFVLGKAHADLYIKYKFEYRANKFQSDQIVKLQSKLDAAIQERNAATAYITQFLNSKYEETK